jgi:uncharacterized membrane protein
VRLLDANGSVVSAVLLPPNGTASLWAEVLVPSDAAPADASVAVVNATAAADSARARGLSLRTSAGVLRAVTLGADLASGTVLAGNSLEVHLTAGNSGNGPENLTLESECTTPVACDSWAVVSPNTVDLARGAFGTATVTFVVPASAAGGVYNFTLTAAAPDNGSVTASVAFSLTVLEVRYEYTVAAPSSLRLVPGQERQANLTVTNRGTVPDNITVTTAVGSRGFTVRLDPGGGVATNLELAAGASAVVTLTIGAPTEVDVESYIVDVLFESVARGTQYLVTLNGSVGAIYEFSLDSVRLSGTPEVGKEVQILATVTNLGFRPFNGVLEVRLSIGGPVILTQEIRSLGPGAQETVVFRWTPRSAGEVNITVDVNRAPGSPYYESSFSNNQESLRPIVVPAASGGFLAERGVVLFLLALLAVVFVLAAASRRKPPAEEHADDPEKAKEDSEDRRKGKESGGLGRI